MILTDDRRRIWINERVGGVWCHDIEVIRFAGFLSHVVDETKVPLLVAGEDTVIWRRPSKRARIGDIACVVSKCIGIGMGTNL